MSQSDMEHQQRQRQEVAGHWLQSADTRRVAGKVMCKLLFGRESRPHSDWQNKASAVGHFQLWM